MLKVCEKLVQQYAKEHLNELSIELMSEYIHETVTPIMVQERFAVKPEDEQYEAALQCMYCEYGLIFFVKYYIQMAEASWLQV